MNQPTVSEESTVISSWMYSFNDLYDGWKQKYLESKI